MKLDLSNAKPGTKCRTRSGVIVEVEDNCAAEHKGNADVCVIGVRWPAETVTGHRRYSAHRVGGEWTDRPSPSDIVEVLTHNFNPNDKVVYVSEEVTYIGNFTNDEAVIKDSSGRKLVVPVSGLKVLPPKMPPVGSYIRFVRDSKSKRYKKDQFAVITGHGEKMMSVKLVGCGRDHTGRDEPANSNPVIFLQPGRADIFKEAKPQKLSTLNVGDSFMPIEAWVADKPWVYAGKVGYNYIIFFQGQERPTQAADINVLKK